MKTGTPIFGTALGHSVAPWLEALGPADAERLSALVQLATNEQTSLAAAARAAFPQHFGKKAVRSLSSFRMRVNVAAKDAGLDLRWCVDTRLKTPPAQRRCWFVGPDAEKEAIAELMKGLCREFFQDFWPKVRPASAS